MRELSHKIRCTSVANDLIASERDGRQKALLDVRWDIAGYASNTPVVPSKREEDRGAHASK